MIVILHLRKSHSFRLFSINNEMNWEMLSSLLLAMNYR